MDTCQYYIKRFTNNPRLCKKNAFRMSWDPTFPTLNLCKHHFNIIDKQIIQVEHSCPQNMRDGYLCAQIASMLQFRQDEFNRVSEENGWRAIRYAGGSDPSVGFNPAHLVPRRSSIDDDVKFIEQRSESEVLDRKMEEAKRDGRYIDLTEEKSIEHIECPVCLDKFSPQNVTFLQCVHPMCNDCFSNIVKRNIAQQCPVCRHPFQENLI